MKTYRFWMLTCLTILVSCSITSCKKGKMYPVRSQQLVRAASIKVGSYFVYIDSSAGTTDSFWVTHYARYYPEVQDHKDKNEYIEYQMESSLGHSRSFSVQGLENGTEFMSGLIYSPVGSYGGIAGIVLSDPFILGERTQSGLTYWNLDHVSSMQINGKNYTDVYVVKNRKVTASQDTLHSTTFYSPDEGLVKFSFKTPVQYQVWELDRSSIVR